MLKWTASLVSLIFLACFDLVNCQHDSRMAWPSGEGYQAVEEADFNAYVDIRFTKGEDGSRNLAFYKCEGYSEPLKFATDTEDNLLGDKRKFFSHTLSNGENVLIQVMLSSVVMINMDQEMGKSVTLTGYNVSDTEYYFVHGKYLFATNRNISDLDLLWDHDGAWGKANKTYYDSGLSNDNDDQKLWVTVREDCFEKRTYCASNLASENDDDTAISVNPNINAIYAVNNYVLFAQCSDMDSANQRCYYYLKDATKTYKTQWYFPQDLKACETEPKGTRIMLYPIMSKDDAFFERNFEEFETTTPVTTKSTTTKKSKKSKKSKKKSKNFGGNSLYSTPIFSFSFMQIVAMFILKV